MRIKTLPLKLTNFEAESFHITDISCTRNTNFEHREASDEL
jgi:hypothetical protein